MFVSFVQAKRLPDHKWGWTYTLLDSEFGEATGEVDTAWHLGIPAIIKEYEKRGRDPIPGIVRVLYEANVRRMDNIRETEQVFTQCLPVYESYRQEVNRYLMLL